MSRSDPQVRWQDVDRVRRAHPDWNYPRIAVELMCRTEYVRATFQRKRWPKPTRPNNEPVTATNGGPTNSVEAVD
jgi:hypothetical protein